MYFNINSGIDIQKIKNNYQIVDTNNKKIYSITKNTYKILTHCQKGKPIESLTTNYTMLETLLKKLESCQVGKIYSEFQSRKKMSF